MLVWIVLVDILYFCAAAKSIDGNETIKSCVSVSARKEEFGIFLRISESLEKFLQTHLRNEFDRLKKDYGGDMNEIATADAKSLIDSVLFYHHMTLHRDMEQMLADMKHAFFKHLVSSKQLVGNCINLSSKKKLKKEEKFVKGRKKHRRKEPTTEEHTTTFYSPTDHTFRPSDCSEILVAGQTKSGPYLIFPFQCKCSRPVNVFCDMETDGGGWTVFLARRKQLKQVNFTQNWTRYKHGFGCAKGEFWLGNEILHILTSSRNYLLRLDATDGEGRRVWGEWNTFKVNSEETKYSVVIEDYNNSSSVSNVTLDYHNKCKFTTYDEDNDDWEKDHCGITWRGGWWYNSCYMLNPTGVYGSTENKGIKVEKWSKTDSTSRYATWLQLKIRPKICSKYISVAKLNTHNCSFS